MIIKCTMCGKVLGVIKDIEILDNIRKHDKDECPYRDMASC